MLNTIKRAERDQIGATRSNNTNRRGEMLILLLFFFVFIWGCAKDENAIPKNLTNDTSLDSRAKAAAGFEQTNLVSDVAEYNPEIIDPNLVNAWGIAISPKGTFWISAADAHLSVVYNDEGETLRPPVMMTGYPTGQVYNGTDGFIIPGSTAGPAKFIFVTEDGYINAWNGGDKAMTIIDESADGVSYTGTELAMVGTTPYLYATNNTGGTIEVYDQKWNEVKTMSFVDPELPADALPFNIRLIDGNLFVTYQSPSLGGLVNVFTTDGVFLRRFAMGGTLNEPWGITSTPSGFGLNGAYLVGNFGDGMISIFTRDGVFKAMLGDEAGNPIIIDGLWALNFNPAPVLSLSDRTELYFTAGPDDEEHGLFGEIEPPQ